MNTKRIISIITVFTLFLSISISTAFANVNTDPLLTLKNKVTNLSAQIASTKKSIDSLTKVAKNTKTDIEEAKKTNESLKLELSTMPDGSSNSETLETSKKNQVELQTKQISLKNDLQGLTDKKTTLDKQLTELNSKIAFFATNISISNGLNQINLGNETKNNDKNVLIDIPSDALKAGVDGVFLEQDGVNVDCSIKVKNDKFEVITDNGLIPDTTYKLKVFASNNEYVKNINIADYFVIDNSKVQTIKVLANPKKGFNYSYYLYIPNNIKQMPDRRLLVEGDNSIPSNNTLDFEENAKQIINSSWLERYSQELKIPVLVPAFSRPIDYSVYPQFLNRGALTTTDSKMQRVDLQLIAMIKDAQKKLAANGINIPDKVFLTGFSSSGKFGQRFAMLHPDMVMALALGGIAGTSTLPLSQYNGETLRFPVGVEDLKTLTGKDFDSNAYSKVPQYLYMGETDTNDATQFPDCFESQDANTIWRILGKNQMPDRWQKTQDILTPILPNVQYTTYKGIGHEINQYTMSDVINFFKANWKGTQLTKITPHQ